MILKYISLKIFIISFAIGILFVYVLGPENKNIYIYPSPETVDNILFKDKAENCFKFNEVEIECPENNSELFSIPLQT